MQVTLDEHVTIGTVISLMFPQGTQGTNQQDNSEPPLWPPDLYACSAKLVQLSGCYTSAPFTHWENNLFLIYGPWLREIARAWKKEFRKRAIQLDSVVANVPEIVTSRLVPRLVEFIERSILNQPLPQNQLRLEQELRGIWEALRTNIFELFDERGFHGLTDHYEVIRTASLILISSKLREHWWKELLKNWNEPVAIRDDESSTVVPHVPWHFAAMALMILSDEVCEGIGFFHVDDSDANEPLPTDAATQNVISPFASMFYFALASFWNAQLPLELRQTLQEPEWEEIEKLKKNYPFSVCWLVRPDVNCVLPKSMTPHLGCTLRSFSNHLALLPPRGSVETHWLIGNPEAANVKKSKRAEAINLLLVPFPYRIPDGCFTPGEACVGHSTKPWPDGPGHRHSFFKLEPRWLKAESQLSNNNEAVHAKVKEQVHPKVFVDFLEMLIDAGKQKVGTIHGIVLPELALNQELALRKKPGLELFITGFMGTSPAKPEREYVEDKDFEYDLNGVYTANLQDGEVILPTYQFKHHRWRLDGGQILNYQLDDGLQPGPNVFWWERMSFQKRRCHVRVIRPWASMATLICEDLGRVEPVQESLRSIAPNLIICILMDGRQLLDRWSVRYAMVLADDPGSSVLTFTSLGLIARTRRLLRPVDAQTGYEIASWKERDNYARSLVMDQHDHAMVLSIWPNEETDYSMDGRSDRGTTRKLSLGNAHGIRIDQSKLNLVKQSMMRWLGL